MSIHTTTPPDDDRLAALIGEAFEALPAPDRWKLKDIEERLSRTLARQPRGQRARRPSGWWAWWLAGTLLAGSVAAWWIYESARDEAETEQVMPVIDDQLPLKQRTAKKHKDQEGTGRGKAARDAQQEKRPTWRKGPVIHRRETY